MKTQNLSHDHHVMHVAVANFESENNYKCQQRDQLWSFYLQRFARVTKVTTASERETNKRLFHLLQTSAAVKVPAAVYDGFTAAVFSGFHQHLVTYNWTLWFQTLGFGKVCLYVEKF